VGHHVNCSHKSLKGWLVIAATAAIRPDGVRAKVAAVTAENLGMLEAAAVQVQAKVVSRLRRGGFKGEGKPAQALFFDNYVRTLRASYVYFEDMNVVSMSLIAIGGVVVVVVVLMASVVELLLVGGWVGGS
jgi:hypothetical protein